MYRTESMNRPLIVALPTHQPVATRGEDAERDPPHLRRPRASIGGQLARLLACCAVALTKKMYVVGSEAVPSANVLVTDRNCSPDVVGVSTSASVPSAAACCVTGVSEFRVAVYATTFGSGVRRTLGQLVAGTG